VASWQTWFYLAFYFCLLLKARKTALKFLKFKALNAKYTGVFSGVFQPNF